MKMSNNEIFVIYDIYLFVYIECVYILLYA